MSAYGAMSPLVEDAIERISVGLGGMQHSLSLYPQK